MQLKKIYRFIRVHFHIVYEDIYFRDITLENKLPDSMKLLYNNFFIGSKKKYTGGIKM